MKILNSWEEFNYTRDDIIFCVTRELDSYVLEAYIGKDPDDGFPEDIVELARFKNRKLAMNERVLVEEAYRNGESEHSVCYIGFDTPC